MKRIVFALLLSLFAFSAFGADNRSFSFGYSTEDSSIEDVRRYEEVRLEWLTDNYDKKSSHLLTTGVISGVMLAGSIAGVVVPLVGLFTGWEPFGNQSGAAIWGTSFMIGAYFGTFALVYSVPYFIYAIVESSTLKKDRTRIARQKERLRSLRSL